MKEVYSLADLRQWESVTSSEPLPLRLAVCGDPVAHSLSPPMHNAALEACGIGVRYCRLHLRPEDLPEALSLLPKARFLGVNLTLPHKVAALGLLDEVKEEARLLGAVNTVILEGGRRVGCNTDGPGFRRAIKEVFGVDLRDLRIMILGTGGAGRAIAAQCALDRCARLVLVNRTPEKARELAKELEPLLKSTRLLGPMPRLEAAPWEEEALAAQLAHVDLVVNATSRGMRRADAPVLPARLLRPHLLVYDTIYTSPLTPLLENARAVGARTANGRSMLLYQGVLAFEHWFNRPAPVDVMRAAMERAMGVNLA